MAEWTREAISTLIRAYKEHRVLYDPKSSLYYNKAARKKATTDVLEAVKKVRSTTTEYDVVRKIQTLRTQYGQELAKIRKTALEDPTLKYVPTLWWFKDFDFIRAFTKQRVSINVKFEKDDHLLDHQIDYCGGGGGESVSEAEATEQYILPKAKKLRRISDGEKKLEELGGGEHTNYVIYEERDEGEMEGEELQEGSIIVEAIPASKVTPKQEKRSRSDELGKFVTSQMATITDELLFYTTQHEILTVITRAQLKQLEKNIGTGQSTAGIISVLNEKTQTTNQDDSLCIL